MHSSLETYLTNTMALLEGAVRETGREVDIVLGLPSEDSISIVGSS